MVLSALERRFGRFAIPHLTLVLIAVQMVGLLVSHSNPDLAKRLVFDRGLILQGEWWRAITFLCEPVSQNPLWALFAWYMFHLMGTGLEGLWGEFRYNVYVLVGYLAILAVSLGVPEISANTSYLGTSVFLAFAHLYPNFVIMVAFVLPVRMRTLAIITWLGYGWIVSTGDWPQWALVAASTANYFLFFGRDIARWLRGTHRRIEFQRSVVLGQNQVKHKCTICGITGESHPTMDFRYCSKCHGNHEYCEQHLRNHEHVLAPVET